MDCNVAFVGNNTIKYESVIDINWHGYCLNGYVAVIFIYIFMYSFRQIMNV